jgi:hypothetical protein
LGSYLIESVDLELVARTETVRVIVLLGLLDELDMEATPWSMYT